MSQHIPLLIADQIFGRKGISDSLQTQNLPKNIAYGALFHFHNRNLFGKVHWN